MTKMELVCFMSNKDNPDRVAFVKAFCHVFLGMYGVLHEKYMLYRNAMPDFTGTSQTDSWGAYKRRVERETYLGY